MFASVISMVLSHYLSHFCRKCWIVQFESCGIFDLREIMYLHKSIKVRSLFKDGKQTAGCTEFHTETGLRSLVSVQKFVHPAVYLPYLKREQT